MDTLMYTLNIINKFKEDRGYAPSIRELCELCDLKSTSTIHGRLKRLKEKGYIIKEDKITRCLSITEKGKVELNAYNQRC